MAKSAYSPAKRFAAALIVGAVLGAVSGTVIKSTTALREAPSTPPGDTENPETGGTPAAPESVESGAAWQYALACREGNWAKVVELTYWMKDRLNFVLETDGAGAVPAEKDRLMDELGLRTVADNRLVDEGVEDQYVFSPGSEIAYESVDSGRDDLDGPVARRTWLKVTYPAREKALLDKDGLPIRSLRVGINVSTDGHVLKGNVIGNLDIDWESIMYDWPLR